jgi:hypothetical protein
VNGGRKEKVRVCLGEWLMLVVTSHPIDAAFHGSHELSTSRIIVRWPYLQNFTGRAQRFQELNVEANSYQTQIVTVYWTKLFRKWDRAIRTFFTI